MAQDAIAFLITVSTAVVYFFYVEDYKSVVKLLVLLGVLVSALIASYSIMASIDSTKAIEKINSNNQ